MQFEFVDFSETYYTSVARTEIPPKRSGKFIQLRNAGREYIVLSPAELSFYHANIAERFFSSRGITGSYNRKKDHYIIPGNSWEIVGGGTWSMDDTSRSLTLGGKSLAYGSFDPDGLKERLLSVNLLAGYTINIA